MDKFRQMTTTTKEFTGSFTKNIPLNLQFDEWHKSLNKYIKMSFKKVRVKPKKFTYCQKFQARKIAIQYKDKTGIRKAERELGEEQECFKRQNIKRNMDILNSSKN